MSTEDNKARVREWLKAVDTGDAGVLDEFLGGSFVDHNPPPFQGPRTGVDGARDAFSYALTAFSDFHHEVEEQFADGDRVISRIVGRGRHTGEFMGIPPTNREVRMEGIAIHRVVDGRLVEHWAQVDAAGLLMQLGALAAPGEAPVA